MNAKSKASSEVAPKAQVDAPTRRRALLVVVLAWLLPGAGHLYLGKTGRAAIFALLVLGSLSLGWKLDGEVPWHFSGSPIPVLATFGAMGSGVPFFILRFGVGHTGTPESAGFEYGRAFLITAGLMNLLLLLDVWDISLGQKE